MQSDKLKYKTGQRLKTIASSLFQGNMSALARKMKMKPQALVKYVKGESMPGGLVLMRLHDIGVDINWFLTGSGDMLLERSYEKISEPLETYVGKIREEGLNIEEQEVIDHLLEFSEAVSSMDISPKVQRALILIYTRHMGLNAKL